MSNPRGQKGPGNIEQLSCLISSIPLSVSIDLVLLWYLSAVLVSDVLLNDVGLCLHSSMTNASKSGALLHDIHYWLGTGPDPSSSVFRLCPIEGPLSHLDESWRCCHGKGGRSLISLIPLRGNFLDDSVIEVMQNEENVV
ncbi:uncharacterized protein G2W53_014165 [Senna tora]|uniref:Uncharacterized protein n=1 Tax=Senna tora TaxID=362788 RepID=A0A834WT01_9FABA|nr:uncharacterized protein G2W53_014165 [Senna tora]